MYDYYTLGAWIVGIVSGALIILIAVWNGKLSLRKSAQPVQVGYRGDANQFVRVLEAARTAYTSDKSNDPIRTADYIVLLDIFAVLVDKVDVPTSIDMELRRNLPAGSWRGLQPAPDMKARIADVREYLDKHSVFSPTGEAIIDNIRQCVQLARREINLGEFSSDAVPLLRAIAAGNIR